MFNFFRKKTEGSKVTDTVFISTVVKYQAMLEDWKKDKFIAYLFWFDDSLSEAAAFFTAATTEENILLLTRQTTSQQLSGKTPIFAEHYPLENIEQDYYKKLNLDVVKVYSALDEPLYKHFGADRIIELVQKLGMKENEAIEHSMVSSSIKKAQKKIEKNVVIEQSAHSQADWLQKNYKL